MSRDPYQGLNDLIRSLSREGYRSPLAVGKILKLNPLTVRADGLDLTGEDLYMAQHLLGSWTETLSGMGWPVTVTLPEATFKGEATVAGQIGKCSVTRPAETVRGKAALVGKAIHGKGVGTGDLVLMLRSDDGQVYYILEKLVSMNGLAIHDDPEPDKP